MSSSREENEDDLDSSDNTESEYSESDHDAVVEEDSINRQIIPYSFEPDYTEDELREQADATEVSVESSSLLATESLVSEWCSCGICSNIEREQVNVCCRDSQIAVKKWTVNNV